MISADVIYNLTYPDPSGDYSSQDEDFTFENEFDGGQKPIIILFGWAGAEDKYLSVYSKIYEAKGFITLRCIIPLKTMFMSRSRIPSSNKQLVNFLSDKFGERHYIIHCFSTGGAFAYQHFVEAVKLNTKAIQIIGVIFDSAISKKRISSWFNAIKSIIRGYSVFNYLISFFLLIFHISYWILEFILIRILKTNFIEFNPYSNLLNQDTKVPQHFIYSKVDKVTLCKDVECFAEHRRSLGVDVTMKMYENTQHVKHYPPNKLSYTESVFLFMCKCFESSMI